MTTRILALNAFHGGSHRAFIEDWIQHSRHDFTLLTLPGSKWKWRMRHSAVTFAEQTGDLLNPNKDLPWDIVFCTDMLNLAEFRGLCPPEIRRLPTVVYFHENQLTYPDQQQLERDLHFAYSNFTTATAADRIWFNSEFHRDEFLSAMPQFLSRMPDFGHVDLIDQLAEKSAVMSPGITVITPPPRREPGPMRIVWVSRWEHDKNPDLFFAALQQLIEGDIDFRVSVLGESYRNSPACFALAKEWLGNRVDQWGFAADRDSYVDCLRRSDVVVSTADHEFFGLAVLEAVAAGCVPVVPNALAYPETLGAGHPLLHGGSVEDLTAKLSGLAAQLANAETLPAHLTPSVERFFWNVRAAEMDTAITNIRTHQSSTR